MDIVEWFASMLFGIAVLFGLGLRAADSLWPALAVVIDIKAVASFTSIPARRRRVFNGRRRLFIEWWRRRRRLRWNSLFHHAHADVFVIILPARRRGWGLGRGRRGHRAYARKLLLKLGRPIYLIRGRKLDFLCVRDTSAVEFGCRTVGVQFVPRMFGAAPGATVAHVDLHRYFKLN